jgi:NitT/TauT family transport system permease protein
MKALRFALPFFVLILWQIFSSLGILPYYKIPSPIEIIIGLKTLVIEGLPPGYLLHRHVLESLFRVFCGFMSAAFLAIPLGILMGWSKKFRMILRPFIEMIRPIPPLAWNWD